MVTLILNTGQGQSFEGTKRPDKIRRINADYGSNITKYRSRFCGGIQNSDKAAPKVPPNLLMLCSGLIVMKEARYRNESDTI